MMKQLSKVATLVALLTLAPFVFAANATIQGKTPTNTVKEVQVNASGQVVTAPDSALNQTIDSFAVHEACLPNNVTATGAVATTGGVLCGVLVSASTTCSIALHDNASAASGTLVIPTVAVSAGTYWPIKAMFTNGLYFTETNTCDVTFYTNEAP